MVNVKHLLIFIFILCIFSISLIISCNPVSENIDDPLWDSLHNSKPFQSDYFHSADYRFPHGACDESQCHGTSLTGGNSGAPSCTKCHDDQWTIFGVSHTSKISGYYHSYHVNDSADTTSNATWFLNCKDSGCHESDLEGIQGVPSVNFAYRYSCKECHTHFSPNTIPPPGHSRKREGAWHKSGGSCAGDACHGADGESEGSYTSLIPGLAGHGPACSDCHDDDK